MARAARAITALTAGLAVAAAITALSESLVRQFPPGPGDDPSDPAVFAPSLDAVPLIPAAIAIGGRALATFVGAWSASRLVEARQALLAVIVAVVAVFVTVLRLIVRPHPFVYSTAMLGAVVLAALAARALALRRSGDPA